MKTIVSAAALVAASLFAIPASAANLVLYTSQPNEDAQATVDGFMAANPDIKVDWVRDGTPKIMAKLRAEIRAGNPVADVLLIADVVTLERLKEDGKLWPTSRRKPQDTTAPSTTPTAITIRPS